MDEMVLETMPMATRARLTAERQPEHCAHRAQHHRLQREQRADAASGGPERAQHADLAAPLHHADGDGVVDEEHADQQRHARAEVQAQLEAAHHRLHGAARAGRGGRPRTAGPSAA